MIQDVKKKKDSIKTALMCQKRCTKDAPYNKLVFDKFNYDHSKNKKKRSFTMNKVSDSRALTMHIFTKNKHATKTLRRKNSPN